MPYLIGLLLDVSSSMKDVFEMIEKKEEKWSPSVFSIVNDLVDKSGILPNNDVFTVGFGSKNASGVFDILGSLQMFREIHDKDLNLSEYAAKVLNICRHTNLMVIITMIDIKVIRAEVPSFLINLLSDALDESEELRNTIKYAFIPSVVLLNIVNPSFTAQPNFKKFLLSFLNLIILQDPKVARKLLKDDSKTFDFESSLKIVNYWLEGKRMNNEKIRGVLENVKPFIYGKADLLKTLQISGNIFVDEKYVNHKKYLFVVSTGGVINEENVIDKVRNEKESLRNKNVKIVSCCIRRHGDDISHSRTLFACEKIGWDVSARALFHLSSSITTQLLPQAIFRARNWKVETDNDQIRLFLQINHPDHIQEACNLASEVISSQDALLYVLGNISLAMYIRKTQDEFTAKTQHGGTCYANASAAVLHLAMKRIHSRNGGYPEFGDIRKKLIELYGKNGASSLQVLREICPTYRLNCQVTNIDAAILAITNGRPLVTRFCLTDNEWKQFTEFFKKNPKGVLTKNELDIDKRMPNPKLDGHAVVLTSFNSECFRFMNSWGGDWGDLGFFRVQNEKVLNMEFIDVFWTIDDLFEDEKSNFVTHGASVAQQMVQRFAVLAEKNYTCPECSMDSKVQTFTGTLLEVCCPKCTKTFACSTDIAMNLYLSSLLYKS